MGARVTDHAALAHPGGSHLELGFHQQHRLRRAHQQAPQRRQHPRQRDERHIGHGQIGPWVLGAIKVGGFQVAQVGAFPQHHAGICAQRPGRLAVAHIDAVDQRRPVLEQAVAEATGGDAPIQAGAALHRDR